MFLTIYITCAIFGTLVIWSADEFNPEAVHVLAVILFMAIFGWVGITVSVIHWLLG